MTRVVNLFSGPGTGKSTSAAYLFARLKMLGVDAELVQEYVKEWAWQGRQIVPLDQIHFLGEQTQRERNLYSKVDVIVTDSPIHIYRYYAAVSCVPELAAGLSMAISGFYKEAQKAGVEHINVFLKRSKPYNPKGRWQTEEQARAIDEVFKAMEKDVGGYHHTVGTDPEELDALIETLGLAKKPSVILADASILPEMHP